MLLQRVTGVYLWMALVLAAFLVAGTRLTFLGIAPFMSNVLPYFMGVALIGPGTRERRTAGKGKVGQEKGAQGATA